MKRQIAAGLAAVSLTVGACSTGGTSDKAQAETETSSTTAPTTTTTVPLKESDLQEALLEVDDLPTGWAELPKEEQNKRGFCDGPPAVERKAPRIEVERSFAQDPGFGPFLTHMLATYDEGQAAEFLRLTREQAVSCDSWTEPNAEVGGQDKFSARPVSFPEMGDERLALRMTVEGEYASGAFDLVYVRFADLIIYVAVGGISVDTAETETLVALAIDKAKDTLGRAVRTGGRSS